MAEVDVSIIIVNWNTAQITCDCLESVYQQTEEISFEVILVDNASSDNSVETIKAQFPQVVLIENDDNRGFAAANNQAMAIAKGRYVLLLNPDTLILDGAIQKTLAFGDKNPTCGIIGIRNDSSDGTLVKNCFQFASVQNMIISVFGLHKLFFRSRLFGRERMSWWDYRTVRRVDVVAGCFMLVKHKAINQVGKMDEAYFMYGEEMDWCWRFLQAGWKTLYYPDTKIIHYGGMSAAQNPVGMQLEQQKSFLYFIKKRQGVAAMYVAYILFFINGLIRLVYWSLRWMISFGNARKISKRKIFQAKISCFGSK